MTSTADPSLDHAAHTAYSEPGELREALCALPSQPIALADAIEEFMIHHSVARQLGFGVPAACEGDRSLRQVRALLGAALVRDSRPLAEHRALPAYLYVTCRDFALLAAARLREARVPARLRVGAAAYFVAGRWEDHWLCEYLDGPRWRRLDAQLGARARAGMRPTFDTADVPAHEWQPASSLWRALREGVIDASTCGLREAGLEGAWFVASAVLRDAASLAGMEVLPWDHWGPACTWQARRAVDEADARRVDALAAALEPPAPTRAEASRLLERFEWAALPAFESSLAAGRSGTGSASARA